MQADFSALHMFKGPCFMCSLTRTLLLQLVCTCVWSLRPLCRICSVQELTATYFWKNPNVRAKVSLSNTKDRRLCYPPHQSGTRLQATKTAIREVPFEPANMSVCKTSKRCNNFLAKRNFRVWFSCAQSAAVWVGQFSLFGSKSCSGVKLRLVRTGGRTGETLRLSV